MDMDDFFAVFVTSYWTRNVTHTTRKWIGICFAVVDNVDRVYPTNASTGSLYLGLLQSVFDADEGKIVVIRRLIMWLSSFFDPHAKLRMLIGWWTVRYFTISDPSNTIFTLDR